MLHCQEALVFIICLFMTTNQKEFNSFWIYFCYTIAYAGSVTLALPLMLMLKFFAQSLDYLYYSDHICPYDG